MSLLPVRVNGDSVSFDREQCIELGEKNHDTYETASPFRHIVLDDFLPSDLLARVIKEFPDRQKGRFSNSQSKLKTGYQLEMISSPFITNLFYALNSSQFLSFLESLTGIDGLISDPHYGGGGLHETARGGHLSIHADFNLHQKLNLWRRLNLILYLNEDWLPEYGGDLELWSKDMSECDIRVQPTFGRAVIFNTTEESWHGHPEPLNCPENRYRRSLALYYYTAPRNFSIKKHTTIFRSRPGSGDRANRKDIMADFLRDICPPVIWRKFSKGT
ncbi:2OG-Fe(II) oxygenase [Biformimicrobium ophioploci]|uniref:2OG-Fe(II) oxygenase n=1 Tax=Biformimicrobium ophioploci TaxID=3036711 RepID=UPI002556F25B|nr:2OG-Fe(II) oxygenase [Microbulbifer sp. NKW57]